MAARRPYALLASALAATLLLLVLPGSARAANPVVTVTVTGSGIVVSNVGGIACTQVSGPCSASVLSGSNITLIAGPSPGATFAWGGACAGVLDTTCTLVGVTVDTAVSVAFSTVTARLTITKDGRGVGTVKGTPGPIDCGATCTAVFTDPTLVTLTATAGTDSKFAAWGGACSGKPATASCTVVVTGGEVFVNATFDSTKSTLIVIRRGTGAGKVTAGDSSIDCGSTCQATYTNGTHVTLTADPDSKSTFAGWAGACTTISGSTCEVVVTGGSITISAVFNLKPGGGGGGGDADVDAGLISLRQLRTTTGKRELLVELLAGETIIVDVRLSRGAHAILARHIGTLRAGDRLLVLTIPRGTAGGSAKLRITIHDRAGNVLRITRTVRLIKP